MNKIPGLRGKALGSLVAIVFLVIGLFTGFYLGITRSHDFVGSAFFTKGYIHERVAECSAMARLYRMAAAVDAEPSREYDGLLWSLSSNLLVCSMVITTWPDKIDPKDKDRADKVMATFKQACDGRIDHKQCSKQYP